MTAVIAPGEFCQVQNNEDYPITVGWDGVDYILRPGAKSIVPAEHVINAFGDPRSTVNIYHQKDRRGGDAWIPDREAEVRRLRCKWAALNNAGGSEDDLVAPNVDVWTLENEEVYTVCKDPHGEHVNPAFTTKAQDMERGELIAHLQAQLDYLIRSETLGAAANENLVTEQQIPIDEATTSIPNRTKIVGKPAYDDDDEH